MLSFAEVLVGLDALIYGAVETKVKSKYFFFKPLLHLIVLVAYCFVDFNASGKITTEEMTQFYKRFGLLVQRLKNKEYITDVKTTYSTSQSKRTEAMALGQKPESDVKGEEGKQQAYSYKNSFIDHCLDKSIML